MSDLCGFTFALCDETVWALHPLCQAVIQQISLLPSCTTEEWEKEKNGIYSSSSFSLPIRGKKLVLDSNFVVAAVVG